MNALLADPSCFLHFLLDEDFTVMCLTEFGDFLERNEALDILISESLTISLSLELLDVPAMAESHEFDQSLAAIGDEDIPDELSLSPRILFDFSKKPKLRDGAAVRNDKLSVIVREERFADDKLAK